MYEQGFNPWGWRQPLQPQATPPQAITFVSGRDGAAAYAMGPNSSAALFDNSAEFVYVKTTDGAGFPTIKTYRLVEEAPAAPAPQQADFEARVAALEAAVAELRKGEGHAE